MMTPSLNTKPYELMKTENSTEETVTVYPKRSRKDGRRTAGHAGLFGIRSPQPRRYYETRTMSKETQERSRSPKRPKLESSVDKE